MEEDNKGYIIHIPFVPSGKYPYSVLLIFNIQAHFKIENMRENIVVR